MTRTKLKAAFVGIACGALLITAPPFMVLRHMRTLGMHETVLWIVQLVVCILFSMHFSGRKLKIPVIAFGYGFLLLYNALAILCMTLGYGIITWTWLCNSGLPLIGFAIGAFYLLMPNMSNVQAHILYLSCVAAVLVGISFVYCTWVPILAVPGAIVLAAAGDRGDRVWVN